MPPSLAALALWLLAALPAAPPPDLEVFVRPGCPHCADAEAYLADLHRQHPDLTIVYHDVVADPAALARLRALSDAHGASPAGVPTFVAGDRLLVGFDTPATSGPRLRALLGLASAPARAPPRRVDLPLVGPVDVDDLGLPLFTVVLGLLDGFNPCAMWALLYLLSLLVNLHDRRRMALVGGTFVLVGGLLYFAFMAAWLEIFLLVGYSRALQVALGLVALTMGAINIKDFFAFGRGPSLSIPARAKPALYRQVRRILRAENLPAALAAVAVLSGLVNVVELLCTAGFPALYTQILTTYDQPAWSYYGYLALYNLAYVLDDSVMLIIAVVTLSKRKLQERGGRLLKLVSGAVIAALGLVLLLFPDALTRLG